MKVYNYFAAIVMSLTIPLYGYADCVSTAKSAEDICKRKGNKAAWYESCYRRQKSAVRNACITNNEKSIQISSKTNQALINLDEKAGDEMAPSKLAIAESNRKLKIVNGVIKKHTSALEGLKKQLANQLVSSKSEAGEILNQYEQDVKSLINRANKTNDVDSLLEIRHELETANIDAVSELNILTTNHTETIMSIGVLEERILRELSSVILTLNDQVEKVDFGTHTEIVAAATTWLQGIESNIQSNTSRLSEIISQKILVNRTVKAKEMTDQQFRIANELEKRQKYLAIVQSTIAGMTNISRSKYRNMMMLTDNYEYALKLLEFDTFCSSGMALNTHQMGCNRVKQYTRNASRISTSTAENTIRFAGMIFAREKNNNVINLNHQMLSLLSENDLAGAVKVYDAILSELEG